MTESKDLCLTDNRFNRETEHDCNKKELDVAMPNEIPASAVQCFKEKYPALEVLKLKYTVPESQTENESDFWWNKLTDLCLDLQTHDITVSSPNYQVYLLQFRNYVKFLDKTVKGKIDISLELLENDLKLNVDHDGSTLGLVGLCILEPGIYTEGLMDQIFESVILSSFTPSNVKIVYQCKPTKSKSVMANAAKYIPWKKETRYNDNVIDIIKNHLPSLPSNKPNYAPWSSNSYDIDGYHFEEWKIMYSPFHSFKNAPF
ncbi:hypothetical protein BD408DRAFT_408031 [Parasitella parasitica]|nr:hypothetical protein BD408DRAFT_408031 [Parasitella parasitica]